MDDVLGDILSQGGGVAKRTTLRAGDVPGDTPWADWGNAAVN